MNFFQLLNIKLLTTANSFLRNIGEHVNSLLIDMKMPSIVGFSYLLAEKISCSAVLSMKNVLYPQGRHCWNGVTRRAERYHQGLESLVNY